MRKFISFLLIAAILISVSACSSSKRIVGTWNTQNTVLGVVTETKYVFHEDGTGAQTVVVDIPFTYTIDGNKLTIKTSVAGVVDISTKEYTFKIVGNKLELKSDGETITLERVN